MMFIAFSAGLAWKEKHLDYEIETKSETTLIGIAASSAWKEKHLDYEIETGLRGQCSIQHQDLEKKSISITRLKLSIAVLALMTLVPLKRKASRLRDWNLLRIRGLPKLFVLKRKASRLRDWNKENDYQNKIPFLSWNLKRKASRLRDWNNESQIYTECVPFYLEKKSISITRLKQKNGRIHAHTFIFPWKEKHLDYEIETRFVSDTSPRMLLTWKEKHLDYEIETWLETRPGWCRPSWKEKHLDYEIETLSWLWRGCGDCFL